MAQRLTQSPIYHHITNIYICKSIINQVMTMTESKEPSLITLHNRLGDVRDRLAALSEKLKDIHDQKPKSVDKDEKVSSGISIVGLNDKATSIQWFLTECENALNTISG